MSAVSLMAIPRYLAQLSPRAKMGVMIGGDALCLPLCMFAAVALRVGSLEAALATAPALQFMLAWLTLPVLGAAGLYRTVVRYIDLRVLAAASGALAVVVLIHAPSSEDDEEEAKLPVIKMTDAGDDVE